MTTVSSTETQLEVANSSLASDVAFPTVVAWVAAVTFIALPDSLNLR
jgi:hypothetical protein